MKITFSPLMCTWKVAKWPTKARQLFIYNQEHKITRAIFVHSNAYRHYSVYHRFGLSWERWENNHTINPRFKLQKDRWDLTKLEYLDEGLQTLLKKPYLACSWKCHSYALPNTEKIERQKKHKSLKPQVKRGQSK